MPVPQPQRKRNSVTSYPPAPSPSVALKSPNPNSWGGEDLLTRLRSYAHVLRSTLQPSLFLIDPSRADIEAHSTQVFDDDAVDDILAQSSYANSHSPVPAHRRPRPLSTNPYSNRSSVLHRSLAPPATNTNGQSTLPSPRCSPSVFLQYHPELRVMPRRISYHILLQSPLCPTCPTLSRVL